MKLMLLLKNSKTKTNSNMIKTNIQVFCDSCKKKFKSTDTIILTNKHNPEIIHKNKKKQLDLDFLPNSLVFCSECYKKQLALFKAKEPEFPEQIENPDMKKVYVLLREYILDWKDDSEQADSKDDTNCMEIVSELLELFFKNPYNYINFYNR